MKTLLVSPYYPVPIRSGGHARLSNIVKYMGRNHSITFLCLITPEKRATALKFEGLKEPAEFVTCRHNYKLLQRLNEAIDPRQWLRDARRLLDRLYNLPHDVSHAYQPEMTRRLRNLLSCNHFNVVQLEYTSMGRYLPLVRKYAPQAKVVLEEIDISYVALERIAAAEGRGHKNGLRREIDRMIRFERQLWSKCDAVVTMSEKDRRHIQQYVASERVWAVPNGVDIEHFAFQPRRNRRKKSLLFLGYFQHPPNVHALNYFLADILPGLRKRIPEVQLEVVGDSPPPNIQGRHGVDGIKVHGYVKDVRPIIADCDVMIAPIRSGGGTRLKILEAFSAGLPVVSTSLGLEGIDAKAGEHVFVGDTARDFVVAVCTLIENRHLAKSIAEKARSLVEQRYSWEVVCNQLNKVWNHA